LTSGGTAGCVLANRLCAGRPLAKVLLLERGQVADSFVSRTPLLSLGFARSDDGVMKYESAPQVHLRDQRKMRMISGKLLGGTSRINNALYSRGHPGEYDEWGEGWTYDELDPLFIRSERDVGKQNTTDTIGEWSTRNVPPFFPATQV
jgi:choline dehydrogenase